jgi:hypothetical protein
MRIEECTRKLMRVAKIDSATISMVLQKMAEADGEH